MRDVIVISPDYSFVRIKITKSSVEGSNNGSRSVTHSPPTSSQVNLSDSSRTSLCGYCAFWHKGECRKNMDACYHCGSRYHLLKDCPQ
ncbi:hypothetical protein GQ457_18G006770 [Hibiscus cannabinus]